MAYLDPTNPDATTQAEMLCRHALARVGKGEHALPHIQWRAARAAWAGEYTWDGSRDECPAVITLNSNVFPYLPEAERIDTVLHELAHHLAWLDGATGHGAEWKAWAVRVGAQPRASFTVEGEAREAVEDLTRVRRLRAVCPCQPHLIRPKYAGKMHTLRCSKCKADLSPIDDKPHTMTMRAAKAFLAKSLDEV